MPEDALTEIPAEPARRFGIRAGLVPLVIALVVFGLFAGFRIARQAPKLVGNYDSVHYEMLTKQWLRTGVYGYYAQEQPGVSDALVPPGYPTFLAPFYALSGQTADARGGPYLAIYIVQLFFGFGLLVLTWLYARTVAGERAAGIAVLLLAPMSSLFFQPSTLLTQLQSTMLFVGYLVVLARALAGGKARWALAAGLVFAAVLMTRPTTMVSGLVPLVVGLSAALPARRRVSLLVLAATGAGVLPWMVRNWIVLGSPAPITGRSEAVLAGVDPYYRTLGNEHLVSGPAAHKYAAMSREAKVATTKLEYAWQEVVRFFRADPWGTAGWFAIGKLQYVGFAPGPAGSTMEAVDSLLRGAIGVLGIVGAVLSVWMRDLMPTALMLVAWIVFNAGLVPDPRYWLDMYPLLATLSGAVLATAWEAARERRGAEVGGG
jgi:4-amino-4-deoxy-L-arabinose transferase-like glycosyltransferase